MVPVKSSIGLISSKISSRPDWLGKVLVALLLLRVYPGPPALVAEQPVERVGLQGEQAGDLKRFLDAGEGNTMWTGNGS